MHRLHKYACVLWRHILMNTVAEVKDVAFPLAETRQYSRHFFFNAGRRRIEHGRVHIALKRYFVAHAAAGISDIGSPVETQGVTASSH